MNPTNRRSFLKSGLFAAGALVAAKEAVAAVCRVTPAQTSGPFIPDDFPFRDPNEGHPYLRTSDSNADLTQIEGHTAVAKGQILYVHGQVVDQACVPIRDAQVYLWQADEHGHYNHSEDTNVHSVEDLDPDFQYRGAVLTDANGRFAFKTIKPKYYPLDEEGTQLRTAHFHFAVLHPQCDRLITQTYFEGDELEDIARIRQLNATDIILAPTGVIRPELKPLIVEYARVAGVEDGLVGALTLSVRRK